MSEIQSGNDPNCKHEKTTPEEKGAFGLVPVYTSNCLSCGEPLFRFPSEQEVSKKDMENAFEQTSNLLNGKPTD
jgi:hypothetical protein